MPPDFTCYAHQELPLKKIKKYAAQYDGVDMAALIGADEDNFPFLIRGVGDAYTLMFWNKYNGMMEHTDEDSVRAYATVQYLREHAYPTFDSLADAEAFALAHNWPRKSRSDA